MVYHLMAILRAVLAKRRTRRIKLSVSSEYEHSSGKTDTAIGLTSLVVPFLP